MSKEGFIFLHRKLEEWEWYDDANTMRLFIHCLLEANFTEKQWHGVTIKRGQFITSQPKLAHSLKLSIMQIRTSLNKLKSTGEITVYTTADYSIITIKNYDAYQQNNSLSNSLITDKQQANNSLITTTNNDKNEKNEEEVVEREKLYGEYQNVFLSESNYNKLLGISLSKKLLKETIDNLSSKIEEGAEQPYKSNCPNAHFIRLKKYIDYRRKHPEKFEEQEEFNPYEVGEYNAN